MKKAVCVLLVLFLSFAALACSKTVDPAEDLKSVQKAGKLVIGITEYAPMNYYDADGELTGFDTEFASAVCAALGVEAEFVVIDWETKELELESGEIDCIWNGLTVSDERRENMDFSVSYLKNEQCVIIRTADAEKFTDAASLAGASVVAEAGSAGETAVKADLSGSVYTAVNAQTDALLEVKAGTADAAVVDITLGNAMTGAGTDYADLTVVSAIDMMDEEYAIGFRVGSNLTAAVNDIVAKLFADGTIAALAEKYELTDLVID